MVPRPWTPDRAAPVTRQTATAVQVARAHSARIADDFVEKNLTFLAGQDPASTTSFQRDILAGRPSEYAAQVGAVPRLGDEVGVDTPINDVIAAVLGRREAQNRA